MDYCFGSSFVDRVDKITRAKIDKHLQFGLVESGSSCPTIFYRDYFKAGAKIAMIAIFVSLIVAIFVKSPMIFLIDKYLLLTSFLLIVIYFFYAFYESKRYKQCTSCQMGNIVGVVTIFAGFWAMESVAVFWWLTR